MNNRDILFIVLIVIAVYLLKCNIDNNKFKNSINEKFTENNPLTITESIKNLGIIAKNILQSRNEEILNIPANINTNGTINSNKDLLLNNSPLVPTGTIISYYKENIRENELPIHWAYCNGNYYLKNEYLTVKTAQQYLAITNIENNQELRDSYYPLLTEDQINILKTKIEKNESINHTHFYQIRDDVKNIYSITEQEYNSDTFPVEDKIKYIKTPDLRNQFIYGGDLSVIARKTTESTDSTESKLQVPYNYTGGSYGSKIGIHHLPRHDHRFKNKYHIESKDYLIHRGGQENINITSENVWNVIGNTTQFLNSRSDMDNKLHNRVENIAFAFVNDNTGKIGGNNTFNKMPPFHALVWLMRI